MTQTRDSRRMVFDLPIEQAEWLRDKAHDDRTTQVAIIRRLIADEMKREKAREAKG